jgi:hypothetical protein
MLQAEGRAQPGVLLVYVTIVLVAGLLVMLPGIGDEGDRGKRPRKGLLEATLQDLHRATPAPAPTTAPTAAGVPAVGVAAGPGPPAVGVPAVGIPAVDAPAADLPAAPPPPPAAAAAAAAAAADPPAPDLAAADLLATPDPSDVDTTAPPEESTEATTEPGAAFAWPEVPPSGPVPVPETGAYLGAYHDPFSTNGEATVEEVLSNLPAFNEQIGRNLGIVHVFQPWGGGWVRNESLAQIADSQGAVPMISWRCGDTNERVATGADDDLIFSLAFQLRRYARPVLLRWFWEVNLLHGKKCLGPGPVAEQARRYRAAFQRIHQIFQMAGATNVSLVWAASTAVSAGERLDDFYPGDEYVDWIAADGYSRRTLGKDGFSAQFLEWYDLFKDHGKPMMVAETGATGDLTEYLKGAAEAVPTQFPQIKALVYFDATGNIDWRLGSHAGGIEAFAALGQTPYFAPMPEAH